VLDAYNLTSGLDRIAVSVLNADVADIDFGYAREGQVGAIGDTVWLDTDGDGTQDPAEAGISGVTVNLYRDVDGDGVFEPGGDDGTAIDTVTTNAAGGYVFEGLAAGSYFVDADEAALPGGGSGLTETTASPMLVALSDGEGNMDADIGYASSAGTGALAGTVWSDTAPTNAGIDGGEIGLGGVSVSVFQDTDGDGFPDGAAVATTTTRADGSYLFTGLAPTSGGTTYIVWYDAATVPAGYDATQPTNFPPQGDAYVGISLAAGQTVDQLHFGFAAAGGGSPPNTGQLGGTVYYDADIDTDLDPGESPLPSVQISLIDNSGEVVATTSTDADGNYQFTSVPPGTYTLQLSDPDGVLTGLNNTDPLPTTVTVAADGTVTTAAGEDLNFGDVGSNGDSVIGDTAWFDRNGDGVRGNGEPGIEGVTVQLWLDDGDGLFEPYSGDDNLLQTVVTDAEGYYEFTSVTDGDYFVSVLAPDAATAAAQEQGGTPIPNYPTGNGVLEGVNQVASPAGTCASCQLWNALTIAGGQPDYGQDFGFELAGVNELSGTVFLDNNDNGDVTPHPEAGEDGVSDVLVILYRVVDGQRLVFSSVASADGVTDDLDGDGLVDPLGFYYFGALPDGVYEIEFDTGASAADGFRQTTQQTADTDLSDGVGSDGHGVIVVDFTQPAVGTSLTALDAGFFESNAMNPVRLSYVFVEPGINLGDVTFHWRTAIETGNVGFNLFVKEDGEWRQLNSGLIPTKVMESMTETIYEYHAGGVRGERFAMEDIDVNGNATLHGPYELGREHGLKQSGGRQTDWKSIRKQHETKKAKRKKRKQKGLRRKLLRLLSE
jgi:hypothetical protein